MKYAKPMVAVLASAAKAIQSGNKLQPIQQDTVAPFTGQSNGAYEADE